MAATLSNTTTARKDGVRVDKGIEPGDNHMRVHYRITNTRDDDAAIRVEESLASAFPLEALDLDAESGGGDWLLDGAKARVALVDIIAAGEEVTTGYVVRSEDPESVESVIDAPEIDMVDPVGGDGGTTAPEPQTGRQPERAGTVDAAAVADAIDAGDGAAAMNAEAIVSELDTEAIVDALDADAVADALEVDAVANALGADAVVDALDATAVAGALDADDLSGALSDDVVVDALASGLADDALADDTVETLREHLAPAFSRTDDLRFQRLRARLEDFAAYADGLEELIDEHGTATEIIDDLRNDIDATTDDLDDLERALDGASGGHETVAARLDGVDDRLETVAGRLDTLTERLDTIDTHIERADDRHERLDARVGTVDGRVDGLLDDVNVTRTNLQTLERTFDESMTELAETLAVVQADLGEVDRWREQVGQAFTITDPDGSGPNSIFRPDEPAAVPDEAPASTDSESNGLETTAGGSSGDEATAGGSSGDEATAGDSSGDEATAGGSSGDEATAGGSSGGGATAGGSSGGGSTDAN